MSRNAKLQKFKTDIEKESNELDEIDQKKLTSPDRQRLTRHWLDLQRKLDDQQVNITYKPAVIPNTNSYLGDLQLKTITQDQENLQLARYQRPPMPLLDPFDNHESMFRSNQVRYIDRSNYE